MVVWAAATGKEVAVLNGHASWVEAIAVTADGRKVATAGHDALIRLWDAETWQPLLPPRGAKGTVWRVEVSRDGKYAAALSSSGVYAWDIESGKELIAHAGDGPFPDSCLFTPEGHLLVSERDAAVASLDMDGGRPAQRLKVKGRLLDFTPDGKTLLTAADAAVQLWRWPEGTLRGVVKVTGCLSSAAVTPDSKHAVIAGDEKAISLVDLEAGVVARVLLGVLQRFDRAGGFTPDGRVLCGATGKIQPIQTWRVRGPVNEPTSSKRRYLQRGESSDLTRVASPTAEALRSRPTAAAPLAATATAASSSMRHRQGKCSVSLKVIAAGSSAWP